MYYEAKVRRTCITEANSYGITKESYLVDAVNYTDVEVSVARFMELTHPGDEYTVQRISKSKVEDVIGVKLADGQERPKTYYKVRCAYVEDIDGHAKKRKAFALVNAPDVEVAASVALDHYDSTGQLGYEVVRVEKTAIVDVINTSDEELES